MSKEFYPETYCYIPAGYPHSKSRTRYFIAVGEEDWSDGKHTVVKIQMMYYDASKHKWFRSGRRAPSFPIEQESAGSNDWNKVQICVNLVLEEYRKNNYGEIKISIN